MNSALSALKNQQSEIVHTLERIKTDYLDEMKSFLQKWITNKAREEIVSKSEMTIEMSEDELRAIKRQTDSYSYQVPSIVETELSKETLWFHYGIEDISLEKINSIFSEHDETIRPILGKLGQILADSNIVEINNNRYTTTTWSYDKQGRLIFAFAVGYNDTLKKLTNDYKESAEELRKVNQEIKEIQSENKEETVGSIWDSL